MSNRCFFCVTGHIIIIKQEAKNRCNLTEYPLTYLRFLHFHLNRHVFNSLTATNCHCHQVMLVGQGIPLKPAGDITLCIGREGERLVVETAIRKIEKKALFFLQDILIMLTLYGRFMTDINWVWVDHIIT